MNSKVFGALMVVGPIFTMGMWIALFPSTSGMSLSEELNQLIEHEAAVRIGSIVTAIAGACMFLGLFFLSRTLRDGSSASAIFAEIGGLLILLGLPLMVIVQGIGSEAINEARTDRAAAEMLLAAGGAFEGVGLLMAPGLLLLGVAMALQRKFHIVVGSILAIASIFALVDIVTVDTPGIFGDVGWMGMFLMTVVIGILAIIQKEN